MPDRRSLSFLVILASLVFAGLPARSAEAQGVNGSRPQLTIQQFMQELNNYGEWFHIPDWGWAWQPHDIQPWWVPYTEGEWQYTSQGPYWVSYKPYGWAVFHYGRWTLHEHFGWIWLPDTRWGPGFVCWRAGKGYLGWAPMPPQEPGNVGIAESGCDVAPEGWSFIIDNMAFFRNVEPYIVPRARNVNLLKVTESRANYRKTDFGWADTSIPPETITEWTGETNPTRPLSMVLSPPQNYSSNAGGEGSVLTYAPVLTGKAPPPDGPFRIDPPATPVPMHPGYRAATNADAMRIAHMRLMDYQGAANERLRAMHMHDMEHSPYPGYDANQMAEWHAAELREQAMRDAAQRAWVDRRFTSAWPHHPYAPYQPWHEKYAYEE